MPFSASAQDAVMRDHQQMHQLHRDSKAYIGMLEDPKRDAYQKPHEVLTALAIKPGEVIADTAQARVISPFAWRTTWAIQGKSMPSTSAPR